MFSQTLMTIDDDDDVWRGLQAYILVSLVLKKLNILLLHRCPMMSCPKMCMYGFREDPQWCATCQCKDSACEGVTCAEGQVCQETPLQCLVPPCPVRATCEDSASVGKGQPVIRL